VSKAARPAASRIDDYSRRRRSAKSALADSDPLVRDRRRRIQNYPCLSLWIGRRQATALRSG